MTSTELRSRCQGAVLLPHDTAYDTMRRCWNTAVILRPAIIVVAERVEDIQAAVRFALEERLKVVVQSTGHGAAPPAADTYLLIITSQLKQVVVDSAAQTARIGAGAIWNQVLSQTQKYGLAPLLGSSGTVGVVGYTLGGGSGWLTRKYGLAVDSVLSLEVVTAAGEVLHADPAGSHRELFWGLCGGGGGLAIVTAIELQLHPVTTVFGGALVYPIEDAHEAFLRFQDWTLSLPDEMTSSIAIVNFPTPAVHIRGCFCGPTVDGQRIIAAWTAWKRPRANSFVAMPFSQVASISEDPVDPTPAFAAGGQVFTAFSDDALAILLQYATGNGLTGRDSSPFLEAELRHIASPQTLTSLTSNAYSPRDAAYLLDVVAGVPTAETGRSALLRYSQAFYQALRPHAAPGRYLNFADPSDVVLHLDSSFDPQTLERLKTLKRTYDPHGRFLFGIAPALTV